MADRRTFEGMMQSFQTRLTSVERRIAPLPGRIGISGQETDNWDDALDNGFYWGDAATNSPSGTTNLDEAIGTLFVGYVMTGDDGHKYQEVRETDATRFPITYRRYWNGTTWGDWQDDDPRDTGFVDLSSMFISPATAASVKGRRKGRRVTISGNVTGPIASGVVTDLMTITDTRFRPSTLNGGSGNSWGATYISGVYTGIVVVRTNGTMGFVHRAGTTQTGAHQFTVSFDG